VQWGVLLKILMTTKLKKIITPFVSGGGTEECHKVRVLLNSVCQEVILI